MRRVVLKRSYQPSSPRPPEPLSGRFIRAAICFAGCGPGRMRPPRDVREIGRRSGRWPATWAIGDRRPPARKVVSCRRKPSGLMRCRPRSDDLCIGVLHGHHVPPEQPSVQSGRVTPHVAARAVRQGLEARERDRMADGVPEVEPVEHMLDLGVFLLDEEVEDSPLHREPAAEGVALRPPCGLLRAAPRRPRAGRDRLLRW